MNESVEVTSFIARITAGVSPRYSLEQWEKNIRMITPEATQETTYRGLINPFTTQLDISAHRDGTQFYPTSGRIFADQIEVRRKTTLVDDLSQYLTNWTAFSQKLLSKIGPWSNMIVAGSAVEACLSQHPLSDYDAGSYHFQATHGQSNINVFIYGVDKAEFGAKVDDIRESVEAVVQHPVEIQPYGIIKDIVPPRPFRRIQVVHIESAMWPTHILNGLDVDCSASLFDGQSVWMTPRALIAMNFRANVYGSHRSGPGYELRLATYATRGYAVIVPEEEDKDMIVGRLAVKTHPDVALNVRGLPLLVVIQDQFNQCRSLLGKRQVLNLYNLVFSNRTA